MKNTYGGYIKNWKALDFDVLKKKYERVEKDREEGKKKFEEEKAKMAAAGHVKELTAEEKEILRRRQERKAAVAELGRQEKEKLDEIKRNVSKSTLKVFNKRKSFSKPAEEEMRSEMPTSSLPVQSDAEEKINVDEMRALISIDDRMKEPLAVKFPIIDWSIIEDYEKRIWLRTKRAGGEEERFRTFYDCVRKYYRNDLDEMWAVAVKKKKEIRKYTPDEAIFNHLSVLYEQDPDSIFYKDQVKVSIWHCFTHNGIHALKLQNGLWGFFFIGTRYPWTLIQLRSMLSVNLKCDDLNTAAALVNDIKLCYKEAIAKQNEENAKFELKRHEEMIKKFEKGLKK